MIKVNSCDPDSFWQFDENQMCLEEGTEWSKGDSVGRNAFFYIFHPNQLWLKETLLSCIKVRDDGYVQFYRYPDLGADNMSRDHVSAIILALYLNRDYDELKWILDNLPLQLSRRYWQTLDFYLWQKTLKAEIEGKRTKRFILKELFLLLNLLMFIFVVPLNFLIRLVLGVKSIKPEDLEGLELKVQPKWQKWAYQKLIYPHFALYNLAWMIKSVKAENGLLAWLLRFEVKNFVLKAILGKPISKREYESYVPLTSFQWAGTFDQFIEWKPRPLTETEQKVNDINKSNLDYLYFKVDELMSRFDPEIINKIKNNKPIL